MRFVHRGLLPPDPPERCLFINVGPLWRWDPPSVAYGPLPLISFAPVLAWGRVVGSVSFFLVFAGGVLPRTPKSVPFFTLDPIWRWDPPSVASVPLPLY